MAARQRSGRVKRSKLVERRILDAAAEMFADKGFASTTLQDIAGAFGASRPAIYYYFDSKDALLQALMDEVTLAAADAAAAVRRQPKLTPRERMRTAVYNHVRWVLSRPARFRLLERTEAELPPALKARHDKAKRELLESFTAMIRDGIKLHAFRPVDERVIAFTIIGMCNWAAWWFRPDGPKTAEQVADIIADFALGALALSEDRQPREAGIAGMVGILRQDLDRLERMTTQPTRRVRAR
jgi:AcrR family transcriptional regulator